MALRIPVSCCCFLASTASASCFFRCSPSFLVLVFSCSTRWFLSGYGVHVTIFDIFFFRFSLVLLSLLSLSLSKGVLLFFHPGLFMGLRIAVPCFWFFPSTITEDDSKQDQIFLVKIDEYIGFCVHRRSYLLGSSVIILPSAFFFVVLLSSLGVLLLSTLVYM